MAASTKIALEIIKQKSFTQENLDVLLKYLFTLEGFKSTFLSYPESLCILFAKNFSVETFKKNETIFNQGKKSKKLFILVEGEVTKHTKKSTKVLPGSVIGGLATSVKKYTCTASEDSVLLSVPLSIIHSLIENEWRSSLERRHKFIKAYFPFISKYPSLMREKIAESMGELSLIHI